MVHWAVNNHPDIDLVRAHNSWWKAQSGLKSNEIADLSEDEIVRRAREVEMLWGVYVGHPAVSPLGIMLKLRTVVSMMHAVENMTSYMNQDSRVSAAILSALIDLQGLAAFDSFKDDPSFQMAHTAWAYDGNSVEVLVDI